MLTDSTVHTLAMWGYGGLIVVVILVLSFGLVLAVYDFTKGR